MLQKRIMLKQLKQTVQIENHTNTRKEMVLLFITIAYEKFL